MGILLHMKIATKRTHTHIQKTQSSAKPSKSMRHAKYIWLHLWSTPQHSIVHSIRSSNQVDQSQKQLGFSVEKRKKLLLQPQDGTYNERQNKSLFTSTHHHKHRGSKCEMDIYISRSIFLQASFFCSFHSISCVRCSLYVRLVMQSSSDRKKHLTKLEIRDNGMVIVVVI